MSKEKFKISHLGSLLKETFNDWLNEEPFDLSAIVAFYAIFSLPPLLMIVITVVGSLYGTEAVQGEITKYLSELLGVEASRSIEKMIANSYLDKSTSMATIIGVCVLLFAATGVFMALQKSLNRIWNVRAKPKSGILKIAVDRFISFGMVLALGFLMLVFLMITTFLSAFSDWLAQFVPHFLIYVFYVINFLLSFSVITVLFGLIFKVLPDVHIKWRTIRIGAILTAFLFVIGKFGLAIYFGRLDPGSTYGAAGSVILILLWVNYSCLILFFGAEFTQVYARRYGHRITPSSFAVWEKDYYLNSHKGPQKHD